MVCGENYKMCERKTKRLWTVNANMKGRYRKMVYNFKKI